MFVRQISAAISLVGGVLRYKITRGCGICGPLKVWMVLLLGFIIASVTSVVNISNRSSSEEIELAFDYFYSKAFYSLDERSPEDLISFKKVESRKDKPFIPGGGCQVPNTDAPRANAALIVLSRNDEWEDVIKSMQSLERHFNQWFNYPWVFLNDEPFDENFKQQVAKYTSSEVEFGLIPKKEWEFPDDVDREELYEYTESQGDRTIMYGNMESYHKMCRFFSGYFYEHELVKKRDWYWRVEPDVEFFCDITYDPFIEMEKTGKKYGFTVMIEDLYYTLPGLFSETRKFIRKQGEDFKTGSLWNMFIHDSKISKGDPKERSKYDHIDNHKEILQEIEMSINAEYYLALENKEDSSLTDKGTEKIVDYIVNMSKQLPKLFEDRIDREEYNWCHFWSNFEIARTDLFNNPTYKAYFKHLDESGGFYKERWGDAPVHSLGIAMMLNLEEVHYFRDIGYRHSVLSHCPRNSKNQLPYTQSERYPEGLLSPSQESYWLKFDKVDTTYEGGTGCRCRCPKYKPDVEDTYTSCIPKWARLTDDSYKSPVQLDIDYWEKEIRRRIDSYLRKGGKLGEESVLNH